MIECEKKGYDDMQQRMMKSNKGWTILFNILFIILIVSSLYMLYSISLLNGIENMLRLIGAIAVIVLAILLIVLSMHSVLKHQKKRRILFLILIILYSLLLIFVARNIHLVIEKLGRVSTTTTTYSASLVTLNTNKAEKIEDVGASEIGMLKDESSVDGNQIPKEMMKKNKSISSNKVAYYDDYVSMLKDLYDEKIDYIFLPSGYVVMFNSLEGFEHIGTETKVLESYEKNVKSTIAKGGSKIDKPFTLLLMGVDSEKENIKGASFNGDSLMLITFNPTTLNTTIVSIPRDTYVPIACLNGRKNKITHAAWGGESCMISTIENFTGIKIDYYAKINFKGVVKLVDALGGIDVDVPIDFCEQDSNRDFGNLICLNKGYQTLNGEQALALSRHRKTINDFIRGQNQQLVVKGLMNKAKSIRSIDTIYDLLDTLSNNMETNMTTNEILSFYNVAKEILEKSKETSNIDELLGMQRLYISGFDAMIYDYDSKLNAGTKLRLYNFVPYDGSIKDVVNAMKINLEIESPKLIKSMEFDVDEPYVETVIGKGTYKGITLYLLPNFVGYNQSKAIAYGKEHGLKINVNVVSSAQNEGQVISQSLHDGMDLNAINKNVGLTITVSDGKGGTNSSKEEEDEVLPNFVGKLYNGTTLSNFLERNKTVRIVLVKVSKNDKEYDSSKKGQIIFQDKKAGTELEKLKGETITLKYIDPTEDTDDNENKDPDDNENNEEESEEKDPDETGEDEEITFPAELGP
ncbi:MAG: PASTA domain-containing protein [Bacilli bacterium]|nr:PASTA domain-containing protein [Bacilli bacterium]